MKEGLIKIEELIRKLDDIKKSNIKELMQMFFTKLGNRLENYIGDYPTFIEPVYLEDNVKIGDDVLLGPNVYIGANSEIQDYVEISNTIIFDNVKIGQNFKLENCVVAKDSSFNFNNLNMKNSVLVGTANSKSELKSNSF
jgi:NDP-sugar pyrophosphorylase family protein